MVNNNTEEFEKYFKTADSDRNGRISISEAVSFFQKFGLPNTDLAKIWKYVDQEERGFLERTEFYSALKLVTLAQKGFSINPQTVISELYGPNGPQIPAPLIPSSQIGLNVEKEKDSVHVESDWPRISEKDISIYTYIFEKIDKDDVGLISSDQARACFLSWKLPIEVINLVIDLSDLDKDGLFSLRECCIAVYLLERYKEGRIIPDFLPNSVLFDENLIEATGLPSSSYFNPTLESNSGLPNWAHEDSRQRSFHFQTQYVDSATKSPTHGNFSQNLPTNPSSSTISDGEDNVPQELQPTFNYNPNYNSESSPHETLNSDYSANYNYASTPHETLNYSGPIRYPTLPTVPVEPLFTTQIRYPSIDLTNIDSGQSQTLNPKLEPNKETIGTNTGTGTKEERESKECVVCCEREKNCACLPCGHVATCYECLEMIKKSKGGFCPICRGEIKQVVKIYTA